MAAWHRPAFARSPTSEMSMKTVLSGIRLRVSRLIAASWRSTEDRTPVVLWILLLGGLAIIAWAILSAF